MNCGCKVNGYPIKNSALISGCSLEKKEFTCKLCNDHSNMYKVHFIENLQFIAECNNCNNYLVICSYNKKKLLKEKEEFYINLNNKEYCLVIDFIFNEKSLFILNSTWVIVLTKYNWQFDINNYDSFKRKIETILLYK